MVTMTEAAEKLGIRPQRLYEKVKRGVVSSQRYGRAVMIDPEQARKELEAAGYFRRSKMYKRKKAQ